MSARHDHNASRRLLTHAIVDWPGPLITASTTTEILRHTRARRAELGRVYVYGPQRVSGRTTPTVDPALDPVEFLRAPNTLYLIGGRDGPGFVHGPLAALLDEIVEAARRKALATACSTIAPPLGVVLDESDVVPLGFDLDAALQVARGSTR
jgi:hypothetical protein